MSAVHALFSKASRESLERITPAPATSEREPVRLPPSPYSEQYETILSAGPTHPAPSFGAPTLVWHVAVWPRRTLEAPSRVSDPCDPHDTAGERHEKAREAFEARRAAWLDEINRFLRDLQIRCSRKQTAPRQLKPVVPHDLRRRHPGADTEADKLLDPFPTLDEEAVPFTLWWGNRASGKTPDPDAIRICVHPVIGEDYAAFSFYMDIGQRWGEPHAPQSHPAMDQRRRLLMDAVDGIRRICDAQLDPAAPRGRAAVDLPASPEFLSSPDRRTLSELQDALRAHRNLLYVDIWEAFSQEMSCRLEDIAGDRGEVFANMRGLILSTPGMRSAVSPYLPQGAETASVGTAPFATFSADPRFGTDGIEANAVAKAYWPLVRRITPHADFREHVACGVMDWRALYIADVGAPDQYVAGQERPPALEEEGEASVRVPLHLLADAEKPLAAVVGPFDSQVRKRAAGVGNNHPMRYLLLTKHEPHPREVGRIAEALNRLGTVRLLAFKDWSTVRDADQHLRLMAQDLDRIARQWSADRHLLGRLADLKTMRRAAREVRRLRRVLRGAISPHDVQVRVQAFDARDQWPPEAVDRLRIGLPGYIPRRPLPWPLRLAIFLRYAYSWGRYREALATLERSRVARIRARALHAIAQPTEAELAGISARLDELALGGVGGLRFRLERSARCLRDLQVLLKSLRITAIPSWVSYGEHAERGLMPAFDRMRQVARRLKATEGRLRTLAASVEASALRGQFAAERDAAALTWRSAAYAAVLLAAVALAATSEAGGALIGRIAEILRRLAASVPAWLTGPLEWALGWLRSGAP